MRLPTAERQSSSRHRGTANERFRAGDRGRLRRCIALSVAVHAAVVVAWPQLPSSSLLSGGPAGTSPLELVALEAEPPGQRLVSVAPSPEDEAREAESPAGAADEDGSGADDDRTFREAAIGGDGSADALERIAAVRAGVIDGRPRPAADGAPPASVGTAAPAPDVPDAGGRDAGLDADATPDGEDVRIPSASSDLDERLSDQDMMRLERLSSLRPGLSLGSMSKWLVVKNPRAVRDFMRRRFPASSEDRTRGALSVSLWVDERGSVEWVEINRSSGRPELDETALELFEQVIAFAPARQQRRTTPTAAIFWLSW